MSADWLGLACEWHQDGELVRAGVREMTQAGLVIETDRTFEAGEEIEMRLSGGSTREPVYIRCIFQGRVSKGALTATSTPCMRFRLLTFSEAYALLVGGTSGSGLPKQSMVGNDRQIRRAGESEWVSELLGGEESKPPPRRSKKNEIGEEWEGHEPLSTRAGVPLFSDDPVPPEAIVIDDGELGDVVRVLAELGVKTERRTPSPELGLAKHPNPQKLLVVTANQALRLRLPLAAGQQSFVSIAVADSDARMACKALRRLGYQYVISRPIHPFAMSMLFQQAIYPDDDHRRVPREILGCAVLWWGWSQRRHQGVLLDASPTGCQLLIAGSPPKRGTIRIRVPGSVTSGPSFVLQGHVVRQLADRNGTRLGISFEPLSEELQNQLRKLTALPGPVRLRAGSVLGRDAYPTVRSASRNEPRRDRRHKARAAMNQEIVALEKTGQVKHVLVSSDLSVDGMRIEPHPELAVDDQLRLALYEDSHGEPLILHALVARNDGRRGFWLRFVGLTPDAREWIAHALDRFPPVTRLDKSNPEEGRVVLGQVLLGGRRAGDVPD